MYYLCIKTHNKTGLKYLCQTKKKDPIKYLGSGTRWLRHLNVHGNDISTKIIGRFKSKEKLVEAGKKASKKYNVAKSRKWANLRDEEGDGGDTSKFIDYKSMKPMPTGLWKRPDLTNYNQTRINPNKGKKLNYYIRKKMSKSQIGKKLTEEHKRNLSEGRKGIKVSYDGKVSQSKYVFKVNGIKKNLQHISEDTGLNYSLLVQRVTKDNKITYKQLIKPSLQSKIIIDGEIFLPIEFRKKYKLTSQKYYRAINDGLSHEEIVKNLLEIKRDKRKK